MKSIRLAWVPTLTLLTVLVIPGQFAGVRNYRACRGCRNRFRQGRPRNSQLPGWKLSYVERTGR